MTRHSGPPEVARCRATSFVDPTVVKYSIASRKRPSLGAASARANASSGGTGSEGNDVKADVDGRSRVRQRAHRDVVGAGRRQLRNAVERHAAGYLDLRAAAGQADGVANVG